MEWPEHLQVKTVQSHYAESPMLSCRFIGALLMSEKVWAMVDAGSNCASVPGGPQQYQGQQA